MSCLSEMPIPDLRRLGENHRKGCALTILSLSTQGGVPFSRAFGQKLAEERIYAIMKYKRMSGPLILLAVALVCLVTAAFATNPPEQKVPSAPPMSKLVPMNSDPVMSATTVPPVGGPENELVPGAPESTEAEPRSVSISTDFTVKVGQSFKRSFKTDVWFQEDHDAFSIIVTNPSGPYQIIVENSSGWSDATGMLNGDYTWYFWEVVADDTYTVYIQNVGTSELTGHVKISSYYHSDI